MRVVPSLREAVSLSVSGDVVFDHPVEVIGKVRVVGVLGSRKAIPADVTNLQDIDIQV